MRFPISIILSILAAGFLTVPARSQPTPRPGRIELGEGGRISADPSIDPGDWKIIRERSGDLRIINDAKKERRAPMKLSSHPDDFQWSGALGSAELGDGHVNAIAQAGDTVYVGGWFSEIGGIKASNVALWDRKRDAWYPLRDGEFEGVDGDVQSILVDGSDVYVGGYFTSAGELLANNVAMWNGGGWKPLGRRMNGQVTALAMVGGKLYAGGNFTVTGSDTIINIARLDGTDWGKVGVGISGISVSALLATGNDLYVGGTYITITGAQKYSGLLKWDGANWSDEQGNVDIFAVNSLALGPDGTLYAGGIFQPATGDITGVARRNGGGWELLGGGVRHAWPGLQANIETIAVGADGRVYTGGFYVDSAGEIGVNSIAMWDGARWKALGKGIYYDLHVLAAIDGRIYAGGSFSRAGTANVRNMAVWDGSTWGSWGSGASLNVGYINAIAVAPNGDIYAGGSFSTIGGIGANNIARWNGSAWNAIGTGVNGEVNAIAFGSGGDIYVGGNAITKAGDARAENIVRWDGSGWSSVGNGLRDADILTLAYRDGGLYAGGYGIDVDSNKRRIGGIALWDGGSWKGVGGGLATHYFSGVATGGGVTKILISGSDLYVAGTFDSAGGIRLGNLAKWDGTRWSDIGGGVSNADYPIAYALVIRGNELIVGGEFSNAGTTAARNIARYDLTTGIWSGMGDAPQPVTDLMVLGSDLYATGFFSMLGDVEVSNIGRWDGTAWSPLGSGLDGGGRALAVTPQRTLLVGGQFSMAGKQIANGLAAWGGSLAVPPETGAASDIAIHATIDPAARNCRLQLYLPERGVARVTIYNLLGQEIARPLDEEELSMGNQEAWWHTDGVPAGHYFCRLTIGARTATSEIIVP